MGALFSSEERAASRAGGQALHALEGLERAALAAQRLEEERAQVLAMELEVGRLKDKLKKV